MGSAETLSKPIVYASISSPGLMNGDDALDHVGIGGGPLEGLNRREAPAQRRAS